MARFKMQTWDDPVRKVRDMSEEKLKWIDKVLDVFMHEIETPPVEQDEFALMRKIMTVLQYRVTGLDHRKIGMLAADLYRLTYATRQRVIEEVARVAASADKKAG
jgi:hypothetical protein